MPILFLRVVVRIWHATVPVLRVPQWKESCLTPVEQMTVLTIAMRSQNPKWVVKGPHSPKPHLTWSTIQHLMHQTTKMVSYNQFCVCLILPFLNTRQWQFCQILLEYNLDNFICYGPVIFQHWNLMDLWENLTHWKQCCMKVDLIQSTNDKRCTLGLRVLYQLPKVTYRKYNQRTQGYVPF